MRPALRASIEILAAATLGFAAVVVPVALDPSGKQYESTFLPIVGSAVWEMTGVTLLGLFLAGAIVGAVGRMPFWLIGIATMLAFPVWSLIDLYASATATPTSGKLPISHNLLPMEWLNYGVISLIGVLGAGCSRWVRLRLLPPQPIRGKRARRVPEHRTPK